MNSYFLFVSDFLRFVFFSAVFLAKLKFLREMIFMQKCFLRLACAPYASHFRFLCAFKARPDSAHKSQYYFSQLSHLCALALAEVYNEIALLKAFRNLIFCPLLPFRYSYMNKKMLSNIKILLQQMLSSEFIFII